MPLCRQQDTGKPFVPLNPAQASQFELVAPTKRSPLGKRVLDLPDLIPGTVLMRGGTRLAKGDP